MYKGRMTTGRRSAPISQTACTGGDACHLFAPATIQCLNRGFDGSEVQWECKADMDTDFRFGSVTVACEVGVRRLIFCRCFPRRS